MKRNYLNYLVVVIVFLLAQSCITFYAAKEKEAVEIKQDDFEPIITVVGITKGVDVGNKRSTAFLRSFIVKETKTVRHQVYVDYTYTGYDWHFINNAYLMGGESVELTRIDTNVWDCSGGACYYNETVGISINDAYLRQFKQGFSIKVSANSGHEFFVHLSFEQIQEQIKAVDSLL